MLFSLELGPDVRACGPELAIRRGKTLTRSRLLGIESKTRFQPVPGGRLLAVGPTTDMASATAETFVKCGRKTEPSPPTGESAPPDGSEAGELPREP